MNENYTEDDGRQILQCTYYYITIPETNQNKTIFALCLHFFLYRLNESKFLLPFWNICIVKFSIHMHSISMPTTHNINIVECSIHHVRCTTVFTM